MNLKTKFSFILTILLIFFVSFIAQSNTNEWSEKMMNFVGPVSKIYSIDLMKPTFDAKEIATLEQATKDLRNTSHGLKFSVINFFSKKDPAVEAEYKQFKSNLDMAEKTMAFSPKQSVFYLRSAVGQCASCHSKGGKSTHLFELFKDTKIPSLDKGRLALALRDYEASTNIFKSILLEPSLQDNYFKMNDVLVSYLNAAILNNSPKNKIIEELKSVLAVSKNKGTQNDINSVITDIESSKPLKGFDDAVQKFESYSKDISNFDKTMFTSLNVKNILHGKLKNLTSLNQKAKAYETLGYIYSHYTEISIFMVPESYYELCIQAQPKTDIAKKCFEKYENKIVLGYSGSMGSNVPEFEKVKIQNLRKQAF